MNSFFFWLTVSAGVGAMLAQILRPGAQEILIVVTLANLAFYGYRRITSARLNPAS